MTELQYGQGLQSIVTYTLGTFSNLYRLSNTSSNLLLYLLLESLIYTPPLSSRYLGPPTTIISLIVFYSIL